jgi:predicted phage-related endonuclease
MSTEINMEMVDLDQEAQLFLNAYIEAKEKIKEWSEKADLASEQVKAAMGRSEIGLVNGREAVRWTTVESARIDVKKIRELLTPEEIENIQRITISRRFTIVGEE